MQVAGPGHHVIGCIRLVKASPTAPNTPGVFARLFAQTRVSRGERVQVCRGGCLSLRLSESRESERADRRGQEAVTDSAENRGQFSTDSETLRDARRTAPPRHGARPR